MGAMPNFLVIGASRSGTTALHNYLRQHPDVFMPASKEPNFFLADGHPLSFSGPAADWVNNSVSALDDYQALFEPGARHLARGEASPLYLFFDNAPAAIKARVPDVRMIAVLRDPAEQAYSHFMYAKRNMLEPLDDFTAALAKEDERIAAGWQPMFHYASFPRYGEQLARYFQHFDRSQIQLFLYEEFDARPLPVLSEMFAFIGVDEGFEPDVSYRPNASGRPKNKLLQDAVMSPHLLTRVAGAMLPQGLRQRIKDVISGRNVEREELPADAKAILRARQREDTLRLQDLIGRDLSGWLR